MCLAYNSRQVQEEERSAVYLFSAKDMKYMVSCCHEVIDPDAY